MLFGGTTGAIKCTWGDASAQSALMHPSAYGAAAWREAVGLARSAWAHNRVITPELGDQFVGDAFMANINAAKRRVQ